MVKACLLSIVAPCFNEEEVIDEFCRRALQAAGRVVGSDFELVLIDDGSRDGTWHAIETLSKAHSEIVGVRLMRNHGHQLAATAGLSVARGQRLLLIDADLQDPPELLAEMMSAMDEGADVVYGQRQMRKGESWFKLTTAAAFYRLLPWLATVDMPRDTGDFRLMSRRVTDILLSMPEQDRFLRGLVSWVGGKQVPVFYERDARYAGTSKYPLPKMVALAFDAITSFSTRPLRLASWIGVATAFLAFCLLLYTLIQWAAGNVISGWSSLMVALTMFSAIQLLTLGILGEYLGRLVMQSKGRPLFMIDRIVGGTQNADKYHDD
jgi:polyisoprenyl-phosphate glycosyltransferase